MAEQEKTNKLQLHHLKPAPGSKKTKIRVGRGEGGRRGKTAGRGTKGLNARSKLRPGFEGGSWSLLVFSCSAISVGIPTLSIVVGGSQSAVGCRETANCLLPTAN